MATPDVRVRLSAEGAKEVIDLFKRLNRESTAAARSAGGAFDGVGGSLSKLKGLLGTLGIGVTIAGLVGFGKAALDAADDTGRFAVQLGTTAERVSTLQQASVDADVDFASMRTGLVALSRSLIELKAGSKEQTQAFRALGLAGRDFAGLDTAQAFELVSRRLGSMEAGTARTGIALKLLSRQGAELLPVMQLLADEGLAGVEERARSLGVLITGDLARAAEITNDSFDLMKLQARGLATAFVSGLAPSVVEVMAGFSSAVNEDGVQSMQRFGREAGRIIRVVVELFRGLGSVVGQIFNTIGDGIGATFAAIAAAFRGDFAGAVEIVRGRLRQLRTDVVAVGTTVGETAAKVVAAARGEAAALPAAQRRQSTVALDEAAFDDPAARARASAAAKREMEARQKLFDDQRKLQQDASEIATQTSNEIIALAGRERDAKIAALEEEIRRRQLILALAGQLGDRERAQLDRFRELSTARIDFDDLRAQGEAALDSLERERTRIEQNVQLGLTSQIVGQSELIRIEQERVGVLRELAAALAAAAAATGDPSLIAQAEQFAQSIRSIEVSIQDATDTFAKFKVGAAEALQSGLADFFDNAISGAQSVQGAFKSLADSVVGALRRIAAEAIATQILGLLSGVAGFGFLGKVIKKADGGLIRGPGSDRSDNIPALLSPGEYVIRAAAVRQLGVDVLHALNRGVRLPRMGLPAVGRFADGGLVGPLSTGVAARDDRMTVAPTYNISGLGLSFEQVQILMKRNNEDLVRSLLDRRSRR